MWIYWLIISISSLWTKIASICIEHKSRKKSLIVLGVFSLAISILTLSIFAALRNPYEVGVDTGFYGISDFTNAKKFSWDTFNSLSSVNRYPLLSKALIWIPSHLTQNFFIYLMTYALMTYAPIVIVSFLYLKKNAWAGVFVYGILLFPSSLNIIRQYEAESFCLVSLYFLCEDKPIKSLISFFVSVELHTSALIFSCSFIIYFYLKNNSWIGFKNINLKSCLVVIVVVLICVFYSEPIFNYLFSHSEAYRNYIQLYNPPGFSIVLFFSVFFCFFSFLFIVFEKKREELDYKMYFLLVLCLVGVAAFSLSLKYKWMFRLGLYFYIVWVFFFPKFISIIKGKHEKVFISLFVVLFMLSYSYVNFEVKGHDNVVPYVINNNWDMKL